MNTTPNHPTALPVSADALLRLQCESAAQLIEQTAIVLRSLHDPKLQAEMAPRLDELATGLEAGAQAFRTTVRICLRKPEVSG